MATSTAVQQDFKTAVRAAAGELGMDPPAVVWHATGTDEAPDAAAWVLWGDYGEPGEARHRIHANLGTMNRATPAELAYYAYHETRHVWQALCKPWLFGQEAEEDAERWAYQQTGTLPPNPYSSQRNAGAEWRHWRMR